MKVKKKGLIENTIDDKISLLLLLFTATIVPLLVRISMVEYPIEHMPWINEGYIFFDIYSYIKSNVLILLGGMGLFILGFKGIYKNTIDYKSPIFSVSLVGICTIVVSTLTSQFKYTSVFGLYERYEGALVLTSYFVIFLLAYSLNWNKRAKELFYITFFVSNLLLSIIGVLQYFGHDPLIWSFVRPIITSFELNAANINIDSTVNYRVIGQTLYHYNYVSFFATLSLPIFLTRTLYEKNLKIKLSSAMLSLLILFNLFGSSARGGMVGLSVGLLFWIVLNWKLLFSNLKVSLIIALLLIASFVGFELISDGFVTKRFAAIFKSEVVTYQIKSVFTEDDVIVIETATDKFTLETDFDDNTWTIKTFLNDAEIQAVKDEQGNFIFKNQKISLISYHFEQFDEQTTLLVVVTDGLDWPFINKDNKLYLKNIYGHDVVLKNVSSFGFEGREKVGSSRGYIWSRTFPLIASHPFVGYGPDTFAFIFPQEDYIGKYYSYGTQNMIVDKAHNIYLQQAMNSGIINLIVYITLIILFIFSGFKKYVQEKYRFDGYLIPALMVAIISYAIAGLFNDSSVHVAPVYWVMLGMGLSLVNKKHEKS